MALRPFRGGVEDHQLVVEAQRVLDVELRDAALRLAGGGVGGRRELVAGTGSMAPIWARMPPPFFSDTTKVLAAKSVLTRAGIGVGGEVAEIGLLVADEGALAFEIDVGEAEDVAVLDGDDGSTASVRFSTLSPLVPSAKARSMSLPGRFARSRVEA